jgi:hypothetical protein
MSNSKALRSVSFTSLAATMVLLALASCSEDAANNTTNTNNVTPTGGVAPTGGSQSATGGTVATGGTTGGTVATGGVPTTGGTTGGTVATGGVPTTGGTTGGTVAAGGTSGSGTAGKSSAGSGGTAAGAAGTAGQGGTTSGGSGGGSGGFDPCPAMGDCKVLPLGDSITDGIGFSGGYRVELFSKAISAGKNLTFVGKSMNGPDKVGGETFPKNHEGHSGWTIEQIDGIVETYALDPEPHIVLLHIGTNDMRVNANGATDRLETLVDRILADLPNSLLVLSNIIFMGFPNGELGDGVHPNQAGYARMAGKWYTAIEPYLH